MTSLNDILDVANLERHIAEGNVSVQVGAGDGMRIFNYTGRSGATSMPDAGNPKNQGATP